MGVPLKSKDLFPQIFSRHAAAYQERLEGIMARGEALGRNRLLNYVDAQPGMRVLDLACGPGTLAFRLAASVGAAGEVVGVDLAPGMIELARAAHVGNARFEVMDIEKLALPDASFDAATCGHGLQFVPDLAKALRETHRVLRPAARFGASIPLDAGRDRPWLLLFEVVDRWLPPAASPRDQKSTLVIVNDRDALQEAVLRAGFSDATVEVIQERVRWESAEQLVRQTMRWWSVAPRLERVGTSERDSLAEDAIETLRREYPGAIETTGGNHVLLAVA